MKFDLTKTLDTSDLKPNQVIAYACAIASKYVLEPKCVRNGLVKRNKI